MKMRDCGGEWKVKLKRILSSPVTKGPTGTVTSFSFFNLIFNLALSIANLDPFGVGLTSSLSLKYLFLGQLFVQYYM